jgi:hypothetical protein
MPLRPSLASDAEHARRRGTAQPLEMLQRKHLAVNPLPFYPRAARKSGPKKMEFGASAVPAPMRGEGARRGQGNRTTPASVLTRLAPAGRGCPKGEGLAVLRSFHQLVDARPSILNNIRR